MAAGTKPGVKPRDSTLRLLPGALKGRGNGARRETAEDLIPHITLIERYFVAPQERPKLVLKRHSSVVLVLALNVLADLFDTGLAHRKRPVSSLPMKRREGIAFGLEPRRGTAFELPYHITQRLRTRKQK